MRKQKVKTLVNAQTINLTINDSFNIYHATSIPKHGAGTGLDSLLEGDRSEQASALIKNLQSDPEDIPSLNHLVGMYVPTAASLMRLYGIPACEWIQYRYVILPAKLWELARNIDADSKKEFMDPYLKVSLGHEFWNERNGDKPISIEPRHAALMEKVRSYVLENGGSVDYDSFSTGIRHSWGKDEMQKAADELEISVKQFEEALEDLILEDLFYLYPPDDQTDDGTCGLPLENLIPDNTMNPEHVVIKNEEAARLFDAIKDAGLTPQEKLVLIMHYGFDDGIPKSLKEIHRQVGEDWRVSETTMKRMHRRALAKIKKSFK